MRSQARTELTTELLRRLLQVPDHATLSYLIGEARVAKWNLPVTVFSLLGRDGVPITQLARYELDRHSRRVRQYDDILACLEASGAVYPIKGPGLAALYDPEIVRQAGDLDLYVPDRDHFWAAASQIATMYPSAEVDLSYIDSGRNIVIGFTWPPSEEPLLDADFAVELVSTPFAGNGTTVPARDRYRVQDRDVLNLLALAEERFQRAFGPTDFIDLIMLFRARPSILQETLSSAEELMLAPELAELLAAAVENGILHPDVVSEDLNELAAKELRRRARTSERTPDFTTDHRLGPGIWHGLKIADSPSGLLATEKIMQLASAAVVECPIGAFLLTSTEVISGQTLLEAQESLSEPFRNSLLDL